MRRARVVEDGGGFYHVISRVVGRERLLCDESDPKDYRFSGYGEAMGGSEMARDGFGWVVGGGPSDWSVVGGVYRQLLYIKRHRGYFSEKRRDGARAMRGAQWGGLFTARDLRKCVITAATPAC